MSLAIADHASNGFSLSPFACRISVHSQLTSGANTQRADFSAAGTYGVAIRQREFGGSYMVQRDDQYTLDPTITSENRTDSRTFEGILSETVAQEEVEKTWCE